ncbi:MAG TPA: hydrogenase maturation nickel metallochaperone HypA [Gammaproteobacteria bacterium]|nr:hydrogenase maturation nickel metallochaperone HypA [Gammaproteobacteria bacterium]
MHEKPIVEKIVALIKAELDRHGRGSRLHGVTIRLGELSGIKPEPVRLYFDELTRGTSLQGATLEFEEVGPGVRCTDCQAEVEAEEGRPIDVKCPACGSTSIERLTGEEVEVVSIDLR